MENMKSLVFVRTTDILLDLKNGIDPFNKNPLDDNQILKHERVVKLCSYAYDVVIRLFESESFNSNYMFVKRTKSIVNEENALKQASLCFEKLSRGENPFDKSIATPNDLLNSDKMKRFMVYMSKMLSNVHLEKGDFFIDDDSLVNFEYSDTPITISDIKKRVDSLLDLKIYNEMPENIVYDFLKKLMFLKNDGTPTPFGEKSGILHQNNEILCSKRMQKIIVNSIPNMIASENN